MSRARFTAAVLLAIVGAALLALSGAPAALAKGSSGWWRVGTEVSPTNLPPQVEGKAGTGSVVVTVSNLGDGPVEGGAGHPVEVLDTLPAGLDATAISSKLKCVTATLACTYAGRINPYAQLTITITVKVKTEVPPGGTTMLRNEASVKGGEAQGGGEPPPASSVQPVTVSAAPTPFGIQAQGFELEPFNEDGTPAGLAGSHPFQLTSLLVMNQTGLGSSRQPVALPKDLRFDLPPGLVGDPNAVEQCPLTEFFAHELEHTSDLCRPGSVVGVAAVTIDEPLNTHVSTLTVPVFNLPPSEGEPARFGFEALGLVFVEIDTSVRTGGDYGVVAIVQDAPQAAGLLSSEVTFWGVPGDPRHNQSRGWECVEGGLHDEEVGRECPQEPAGLSQTPFLTLPGSCAANPASEPLTSSLAVDSWAQPGSFQSAEYAWLTGSGEPLGLEGCAALPFTPSIEMQTESHAASTPTGVNVDVRVPQQTLLEANPQGHAEADVKDTTITLPEGVQLNPSAANGLAACAENEIGYTGVNARTGVQEFTPAKGTSGKPLCPEASKVATVAVKTPLLPHELQGGLYLASPAPNGEAGRNPFGSLLALYLIAEDPVSGVLVKLAGKGELDQATGRITTTFSGTPQLPFEELKVHIFGGPGASLSTPPSCGSYTASSAFTAWSGAQAEPLAESPFVITSGPGGGACPSGALSFEPSFNAQSDSTAAGAFSPFTVEIGRPDGSQALTGVTVGLPAGVAALLSTVVPCQEPPPGVEWECGPESLVGHSTAKSGLGSEPVALAGDAYLTTGFDGAPFGLLVRTKAEAGPFDLGYVNVRSRIDVNPETAAVTVSTDPGPHGDALITMLKGIPVQLKRLQVSIDRPGFEFNPTSCDPMSVTGTLSGSEDASVPVSSRFQVGGCESLPFHPGLTATVGGHASKANGTGLDVKITSQGLGVANIKKVNLQLPVQLPSRQSTLNQACLAAVFQTNPASCPEGSVIGTATVHTPVLRNPLTGPAYLVSHGNAAFPDVEFVLQGEGITLILDGHTDIKNGITYSRFESAPDEPFTSFETSLPAGPHGILTAYASEKEPYELCSSKLTMPTQITAQNGAVIEQDTPITPTGCTNVLATKTHKPTRAQQLAKALTACRHKHKHNKPKRSSCERAARKRYAAKPSSRIARKAHQGKKRA